MADGVIGSVGVSVVPDANDFWRRFEAQTRAGAAESGRRAGAEWQRGFESSTHATSINVRADTTQARTQIAALNKETSQSGGAFQKLISAAITLSPALVPLGAAAAAAGAEFVVLGASAALALKGLKDDFKALTPQGAEVRQMVRTLKGGLDELSKTAAKGALPGLEQAVGKLRTELPKLNSVIRDQSQILGDVASHLAGGLIGGFKSFAPVLDQVGGSVDRIAAHFETWANGPGGAKFGSALADSYAKAAPLVDDIATAIMHLIAASQATGLGILTELGLLARVVSSFPTPVLSTIVAGFVAFRAASAAAGAVRAITVAMQTLDANTTKFAVRQAASAAAAEAANLQIAAASAAEAASVAASQAAVAEAYAASQLAIAQSALGSETALSGLAAASVASSAEQAAAARAAATAAEAAAAQQAAAAEEAALASRAAGANAAFSFTSLLGPLGIVAGAVGFLGLSMMGTSDKTREATQSVQSYTSALVQSNNAINDAVRANVAKTLSDNKAFDQGKKLGITQQQLTTAVTQGGPALEQLRTRLKALTGDNADLVLATDKLVGVQGKDLPTAAAGLLLTLDAERANFEAAQKAARDQEAALLGVQGATDATTRAISNGSNAVSTYVAAVDAFNKSADTAADRAKLMGATLLAANGDTLNYANSMVQAAVANQQMVTDFVNLKKGILDLKTGTIDYHNAAAAPLINDLTNMQTAATNAAAATYEHFNAVGDASAADKAFAVYVNDTRGALISQADQLGITKGQARKLADEYFGIKNSKDLKKKIELLGGDKVEQFLKGILEDLDILAGKHVDFSVSGHVDTVFNAAGNAGVKFEAAGGYIAGPGSGTSDSIPARLSNGEFVVNAAQTSKHRNLLHAINAGAQGFASGGEAGGFNGVDYSGTANKYGTPRKVTVKSDVVFTVDGQQYSTIQAAKNAATRLFKTQVNLGLKIDGADLSNFRKSLKGTADQAHAAFLTMYNDARKLGISDGLGKTLVKENARLDAAIADRNRAADKLKAVTDKFNQVRANVTDAAKGSFDITSAGTGFDGQQPVTFDNIQAQATQAKNLVTKWAAGLKQLAKTFGKSSTGKAMLQDLAERGPSDYPEVQALVSAAPKDLANLISTEGQIASTGASLGTTVGNALYGSQIKDLKSEIRIDEKTVAHLGLVIGKQVAHAVGPLADRPIEIKIGAETVARVAAAGANKNKRRT